MAQIREMSLFYDDLEKVGKKVHELLLNSLHIQSYLYSRHKLV